MPWDWRLPLPTPWVGPGCVVTGLSDFIGPLPSTAFFRVSIQLDAESNVVWSQFQTQPSSSNSFRWQVLIDTTQTEPINTQFQPKDGEMVFLRGQLFDGVSSPPLTVSNIQVPFSATSGLAFIETQTATQGFTGDDRLQLQTAVQQTTVDFTDRSIPTDLTQVPVGRLPGVPPILWGTRVGPFILTGRGTLNLPALGVLGIWIGMRWFYSVIPAGWGMTPGAVDEFANRPAQLVPVVLLQNGEELGQPVFDTNKSGEFTPIDPFGFSGRLEYDVAPGWEVTLFMYKFQPS